MKQLLQKIATAVAAVLFAGSALAQTPAAVPNGTFETWATRSGSEAPQGWIRTDEILLFSPLAPLAPLLVPTGTTTKATVAHGGSFAAQIQNVTKTTPLGSGVLPGVLLLGPRVNPNGNGNIGGGVPYTSRPTRLQFWYKLTGDNALKDSAAVAVGLHKTQSGSTKIVSFDAVLLTPAPNYTLLDIPLTYLESFAPDTLEMLFTSGLAETITAGTTLTVDDVVLTGTVTATRNPATESALQIYPNPSTSGEFSLASLGSAALSTAPLTVADVTGRVVLRQAAAPVSASRGRLVNLRGQKAGVYMLKLDTPEGPLTRKLVIE